MAVKAEALFQRMDLHQQCPASALTTTRFDPELQRLVGVAPLSNAAPAGDFRRGHSFVADFHALPDVEPVRVVVCRPTLPR